MRSVFRHRYRGARIYRTRICGKSTLYNIKYFIYIIMFDPELNQEKCALLLENSLNSNFEIQMKIPASIFLEGAEKK